MVTTPAQRRRQLGGAVRRLERELRPVDGRALGSHSARRGVRHAGHRDLQRRRRARARAHPIKPAAPARRLLRLLAEDGARQRRPPLDRVVLERDGRDGHVRAATRPRDGRHRSVRPSQAPNSESSNNNSFGAALACAATCRLVYGNSPAAGPADTIVSWWPGQAHRRRSPTSRAPGRAPGALSPPPTARTGASGSPGSTARPTARRSATRPARAAWSQDAGVPKGTANGAYALAGIAVGDNLLLAANYAWNASGDRYPSRCS